MDEGWASWSSNKYCIDALSLQVQTEKGFVPFTESLVRRYWTKASWLKSFKANTDAPEVIKHVVELVQDPEIPILIRNRFFFGLETGIFVRPGKVEMESRWVEGPRRGPGTARSWPSQPSDVIVSGHSLYDIIVSGHRCNDVIVSGHMFDDVIVSGHRFDDFFGSNLRID